MLKEELKTALAYQKQDFQNNELGQIRNFLTDILPNSSFIQVITGIRRAGKSTVMKQILAKVTGTHIFINFEDPRLFGIELSDLIKIDEILGDEIEFYFFDEIQNIPNWEVFVRSLHDRRKSVLLTGSNASLLSRELGTRLTGRYLKNELFPFSFSEFCLFKGLTTNDESVNYYLKSGGFPEFLKTGKEEILQNLLRDIVYRDVAIRYGIRNVKELMDVAIFLISNVGKTYSLNKIAANFGIGSANTVANFVDWFHDSYLLFSIPKFSWSIKVQTRNLKKVYCIDTAFARANSLSFSEDSGRLFENMIFLALRKRYESIYYFQEKGECDFVVREKEVVTGAYQACQFLNPDNKEREINGLIEALRFFKLKQGYIVTLNQAESLIFDDIQVNIISSSQFLLSFSA